MKLAKPLIALALLGTPAVAFAQTSQDQCSSLIYAAEQRYNIPPGLLMAIALTESGTKNGVPYPYAMNIEGRGYFAPNNDVMANVLGQYLAAGHNSIDVGCMQINVKYHSRNFSSPYALLNSATNVDYGAKYLTNLAINSHSWPDAVMSYHNKNNPARRAWYGCEVWNNYLRVHRLSSGYLSCGHVSGSTTASGLGGRGTSRVRLARHTHKGTISLAQSDTDLPLDRTANAFQAVTPIE